MAGAVGANIDAVKTLAQNFEQSITAIRSEISKIDDAAEAAKAGWKGDANGAFIKATNNWHDTATTLENDLDALTKAVNDGLNKLISMDQQNA
ncbi:WXG100 family type VII secretion target [Nocardia sp. NEAU-G5]|uniref:ESAT-6-like protein n=1 Tax=Nocardia albiluteola TaxID=2842303 RepID=A0ABS6BDZ2_9NOCA|nr:WXG100 family type VII secretion target [Nocardia albiluteola]MBU3067995.1 WXG100 family type VII secretion target [Nocardia albiluteola]